MANDGDTEALITGTADAALITDEYTGNIALSGDGGNALIKGLSLVDLKTTGEISLIKTNTVDYISLINGNKR